MLWSPMLNVEGLRDYIGDVGGLTPHKCQLAALMSVVKPANK